jgi:hypothetical protein
MRFLVFPCYGHTRDSFNPSQTRKTRTSQVRTNTENPSSEYEVRDSWTPLAEPRGPVQASITLKGAGDGSPQQPSARSTLLVQHALPEQSQRARAANIRAGP